MIDFIELFNRVVRVAKPMYPDFNNVKSMDDKMTEIGIDSLDGLLIMMFFCELYGIDAEMCKEWYPTTIKEFHDLIMEYKTKEPTSIDEAIKAIS
jgi:acyl carrier protein